MTVIYTYKALPYQVISTREDQYNWLTKSINSAKRIGYKCVLYSNDSSFENVAGLDYFEYRVDNTLIWDSLKLQALSESKYPDFFLSDNDVIFKSAFNFRSDIDLYYDIVERRFTWESVYLPILKKIQTLGILDNIPYWTVNLEYTYNLGILNIQNEALKQEYVNEWYNLYSLLNPYIGVQLNPFFLTPVISQYLLTLLSRDMKTEPIGRLNKDPEKENSFYSHYRGGLKRKINKNFI